MAFPKATTSGSYFGNNLWSLIAMYHHHGKFGHGHLRGDQYQVPVNVLRTENSYEIFVIAPDRAKEDLKISLKGNKLTIAYQTKENIQENQQWILNEFTKASFERTFMVDDTIESEGIKAEYQNGVLQVTLPFVPGRDFASRFLHKLTQL